MSYVVTVEACLPDGADELDALQQVGASALLEHGFDAVEGIEGPDGVEVDVLETIVAVHPRGSIVKVFVHAPSLETAEDAVGSVAAEVLERSELLADWVVESSEVKLHIDLTRESLEAADGPDAPPSDLRARRAHHTSGAGPADVAHSAHPLDGADDGSGDDEGQAELEVQIRALAPRLISFGPLFFGGTDAEEQGEPRDQGEQQEPAEAGTTAAIGSQAAELAAGALVYASEVLIDELYDDVQSLADEETNVAECRAELWHLAELPRRYGLAYDELFARRFLVTAIALTTRFTDGSFRELGCLAEELVLKLLLQQAHSTLDLYGLLGDDVAEALGRFADEVYEDTDFEWLYDDARDDVDEDPALAGTGVAPPAIGTWFTPFDDDRYVHPYAVDEDAGRQSTHD
ncbi:hypothetical protein [Streptomyces sp. NBC_00233]|uniref:hypothetical protein n=1 Tax=Streptomyces sp. NBC_00233 TaxID=2975686 RepID=UPI00225603BD|nr:hypothetical protein [Streptomyces sp. NBC_00233]MCX5229517.1 hypothetical protein [Streptomyces sp. NBC_00233]